MALRHITLSHPPTLLVKRTLFYAAVLALLAFSAMPAQAQQHADREVARIERIAPGGARAAARALNTGVASRYARSLDGNRTANGERYDHEALTAAHRSLPFGTYVRVISRRTGNAIVVRINDRGPFVRGRQLDLSGGAARRLGFRGLVTIDYEIVDPATLPSRQPPPPRKERHL